MALCPVCHREFNTPSMFSIQAWSYLRCPHCKARLARKWRPYVALAGPIPLLPVGLSTLFGHRVAIGALVALETVWLAALLWDATHPLLRVKKPLPEPMRLNLR